MEHVVSLVAVPHFEREHANGPVGSKQRHRDGPGFAIAAVHDRYLAGAERDTDGVVGDAADNRESG